jgi:hypothetical protein
VDALSDDPVFSPRSGGSLTPAGGVGRRRTNRNRGDSVITKRIKGARDAVGPPDRPASWGSRASWWGRNPMARVMARPRRAVTQKHGGIAKGLLTRAFTWSG